MNTLNSKKTNWKSFATKTYDKFKIAEFLAANLINIYNAGIKAIVPELENLNPDINIYDIITGQHLGYVEVQGLTNFKNKFDYKYPDFQLHTRRLNKTYNKPTLFVGYDINTDSYLMCSMNKLMTAAKKPLRIEYVDREQDGITIQEKEPICYLPLDIFKKNTGIQLVGEWMKNIA